MYFLRVSDGGKLELLTPAMTEGEWLAGAAERQALLAALDAAVRP